MCEANEKLNCCYGKNSICIPHNAFSAKLSKYIKQHMAYKSKWLKMGQNIFSILSFRLGELANNFLTIYKGVNRGKPISNSPTSPVFEWSGISIVLTSLDCFTFKYKYYLHLKGPRLLLRYSHDKG